jgi:uncharacterized protein (DUF433 family)
MDILFRRCGDTPDTGRIDGDCTDRDGVFPVAMILGSLADGMTQEEIQEAYPQLTGEDVRAALAYAADVIHQDVLMPLPA